MGARARRASGQAPAATVGAELRAMPSIMPYFQQELNPAVSEATTSMLLRLRSVPFSTGLASASVVKNKSACLSLVSRLHRRLVGTAGVPFKRPGAASGGAADGAGSLAPPHAPGLAFAVGPRGEMLDQQEFMNIPTIKTRILRNSYATVVGVASDVSYLLRSMILFYQGAASHLARVMSAAEFFCQDVVGMEAALTNIRPSPVPDGCKICFLDKPAGSSRLVRCKYCLKQFHEVGLCMCQCVCAFMRARACVCVRWTATARIRPRNKCIYHVSLQHSLQHSVCH